MLLWLLFMLSMLAIFLVIQTQLYCTRFFSRKTEATWLYCDFWSCQAAQVSQWQGKATKWQGQYVLRASLTKQNNLRLSTVSLFGSLADLVWSQNITGNLRKIWRIPCHVWKSCSLLLRWHAAPNWEWLEQWAGPAPPSCSNNSTRKNFRAWWL